MTIETNGTDQLSDALALIDVSVERICASEFAAPWSFRFSKPVAHFHIVERGNAWVRPRRGALIELATGDAVVLPSGMGHVLSSKPDLKAQPIETALRRNVRGAGLVFQAGGSGPSTHLLCGQFTVSGPLAQRFRSVLPEMLHISRADSRTAPWLRTICQPLIAETRRPTPGSAVSRSRLVELMFIQAVRLWLADKPGHDGWLRALQDPHVSLALAQLHRHPEKEWTVAALARLVRLSRSAFAAKFLRAVGVSPIRYLTAWRLDLVADRLRAGERNLNELAERAGYASDAALSRAFRARFGSTPAKYRRARDSWS